MVDSMVYTLTREQAEHLRELLTERGWEMTQIPYALFKASGDRVSVAAYESGKLVVQGKNAQEFIEFTLEPEILHTFGTLQAPELSPEELSSHGGIDESGKGDFFGPLVIAGVCTDAETAPKLREIGVCDSKLVSGSRKIFDMAEKIKNAVPGRFSIVVLKPETYNRLYDSIGNLNRLLAWGHARTIENLLELVPGCPRMLSDKFGDESLIRRALMERGRRITLDQRVRAESDVAVAAASILAREQFLRRMEQLSSSLGVELPRGGGPQVKITGRLLLERSGPEIFRTCAKLHFKTYRELLGEHV